MFSPGGTRGRFFLVSSSEMPLCVPPKSGAYARTPRFPRHSLVFAWIARHRTSQTKTMRGVSYEIAGADWKEAPRARRLSRGAYRAVFGCRLRKAAMAMHHFAVAVVTSRLHVIGTYASFRCFCTTKLIKLYLTRHLILRFQADQIASRIQIFLLFGLCWFPSFLPALPADRSSCQVSCWPCAIKRLNCCFVPWHAPPSLSALNQTNNLTGFVAARRS